MKTTIELPDELLRRAKQAALERGTTLRSIVAEALERALGAASSEAVPLRTLTWPEPATRTAVRDADEVLAAIARERERPLDDARYWSGRFGLAPPQRARKKSPT